LETARKLGIGLSPVVDHQLLNLLIEKKISPAAIAQSGLFYAREDTSIRQFKPRFRGRLMIPIRDVQGRIIAFTARVCPLTPADDPTGDAKYINSPETPIFSKSHMVFGLDLARKNIKSQDTPFLLVEGQLDAIRCWENGLTTAVAPQGTSVTSHQLSLLKRYTHQLDIVMDADAAGHRAALRVLPMAIQAGLEPWFIRLPEGEDPDSLLKKQGRSGWESLSTQKESGVVFAVKTLLPDGRLASLHAKEAALRQLFECYEQAESYSLAESAIKQAGRLLGISDYTIDAALPHLRKKIKQPIISSAPTANKSLTNYADTLVIGISSHFNFMEMLSTRIEPEWLHDAGLSGQLLNRFLAAYQEGICRSPNELTDLLETNEERNHFYTLLAQDKIALESLPQAIQEATLGLFQKYYLKQKEDLTRQLAQIDPNDHEALSQLQNSRIQIRRILENPPHFD